MRYNEDYAVTEEATETVAIEEYVEPTDTLWIGYGNEPGWKLMLFGYQADSLSYQLLANYGQEIYTGPCVKRINSSDNSTHYLLEHNGTRMGNAQLLNEACLDDADQSFSHTMVLSWNKNTWIGCAERNTVH